MAINKLISEFLGTYVLVYTVGCNVAGKTGEWAVTSIACSLMVMIYALGNVSGGHFNPAVTAACAVAGKISAVEGLEYIFSQLLGGTAAAFMNQLAYNKSAGPINAAPGHSIWNACAVEFLYTFMLAFVVLNVACTKRNKGNDYYGLAIGFVVIAGGYGAGAISGGCFNPAVAIGLDIGSLEPKYGFLYAPFEIAGGVVAAFAHRAVRPDEYNENSTIGTASKYLSEFIGTFFLCLTVSLNVAMKSPMGAWSIAASLMSMIYALGSVSGAHFNPAVTVSILVSGRDKVSVPDAIMYIISQCTAGVSAMVLGACLASCGTSKEGLLLHPAPVYGPLGLPKAVGDIAFSTFKIGELEMIFTFVLCFTVLCVATTRNASKEMFALAIGSCVTVGGVAIGGLTGGCLNPAVALGVSCATLFMGHADWSNAIGLYAGMEVLGGVVAAMAFRVTHQDEYVSIEGKGQPLVDADEPEEVI